MANKWRSHHTVSRNLRVKQEGFDVFKENVRFIHEFNKGDEPFKLQLNQFGDLTNEEFVRKHMGIAQHDDVDGNVSGSSLPHGKLAEEDLTFPYFWDWRLMGAVTTVKDHGQCGEELLGLLNVEGINKIKTGNLISLSEQQLLDCNTENQGCKGGSMNTAFKYIKNNGGITTESNYRYTAVDGTCDVAKEKSPAVVIDGYGNVPANNENALLWAVTTQPISVAIDAGGSAFQFYKELVDCNTENHGCKGGWMNTAFKYIKNNKGINTESNYPYKAKYHAVVIDGYKNVPANNENALLLAATSQPISVAIDAGGKAFQFSKEGVFSGVCGTTLNHAMTVVGYGMTVDGTKYWTVKNKWGGNWGEKGYIRMKRGIAAKEGLGGIAMAASYPIKISPKPTTPHRYQR
ncbi:Vignain [Acorus gramineus]|uniref:Vignain n=1 Tax=Acorus gramineus TaxID=55184 RepID=A0AAV9B6E0_ACOGR|nr:Vignain [Acorus gramineus]